MEFRFKDSRVKGFRVRGFRGQEEYRVKRILGLTDSRVR